MRLAARRSDREIPIVLAILAKDKEPYLPLYLEAIERQTIPPRRIHLYVRTNNNRDRSAEVLRSWLGRVGDRYASVAFDDRDVPEPVQSYAEHEWNAARSRVVGRIRQESVAHARRKRAHYFVVDCDNFITPRCLEWLLSTELPVVAPLLPNAHPSNPRYANYHHCCDERGYFEPCDAYFEILERRTRGLSRCDVVHCTYLVRREWLREIRYLDGSGDLEYVVFGRECRRRGVAQYLDNRAVYGWLVLAESPAGFADGRWRREFASESRAQLASAARPGDTARASPGPSRADATFLALVRGLVRDRPDDASRALRSACDVERLPELAEREGLGGFLYAALRRRGLADALPSLVVERLRLSYLAQWARGRRLAVEGARLVRALRGRPPELVFLKGPALAERLYGDVAVRAVADLDVLVPWRDLGAFESVLSRVGYRRCSRLPFGRAAAHLFAHHLTYRRDDLTVEAHWAVQRFAGLRIDPEAVAARSEHATIGGEPCRAASIADELVLQLLSAYVDLQLGCARLRSFVDASMLIARLDEQGVEWPAFVSECRDAGLGGIVPAMLGIAFALLGGRAEVPALSVLVDPLGPAAARAEREGLAVVRTSPREVRRRLEWLRLQDASFARSLAWWLASLPVRAAVHSGGTVPAGRRDSGSRAGRSASEARGGPR